MTHWGALMFIIILTLAYLFICLKDKTDEIPLFSMKVLFPRLLSLLRTLTPHILPKPKKIKGSSLLRSGGKQNT